MPTQNPRGGGSERELRSSAARQTTAKFVHQSCEGTPMSPSPSRRPSLREQFVQRRLDRVRRMAARANDHGSRGAATPRLDNALPWRNWSRWLTGKWATRLVGVMAVMLVGYAAMGYWSRPTEADVKV